MEVIVVDNCSVDDSRNYLQPAFEGVKFIWLGENVGFSKACNLALKEAGGQYILFLNPDTIVPEDCFEKCIDFFRSHPNTGGIGVRMIDGKGVFLKESKRGFPSLLISIFKFSGIASLFPRSRIFAGYYMGHLPENKENKVDVLSGAFMLIPAQVLKVTGCFDEAFFMYGEDVDLSYRIQKAGYENYYYPGVTIIHFKGESTVKTSRRYVYVFYNAMRIFVRKHYPYFQFVLYSGLVNLAMFVSMIITVCRNAFSSRKHITSDNQQPAGFMVNGTDDEFENVASVILNASQRAGRMQLYKTPEVNMGEGKNLSEMILCEGFSSFKEIIQKLPELSRQYRIWLHASKSRSIVTSNSKKEGGKTIPFQ